MKEEIKKEKDTILSQIRVVAKTENEYKYLFYKARRKNTKLEYAKSYEYHSGLRKGLEITYKILNDLEQKYNNQPDYKGAWEELKNGFKNHTEGWLTHEDQSYMYSRFENLKKKYNLGGE